MNGTVAVSLQNNHLSYQLTQFSANWTPSAWQITSMNCQGPQGFADLVRQNAATQLQSINPFLPTIQSQIQTQLASGSTQPISWTVQVPGQSGISVTLEANTLQALSAGSILVGGTSNFNFSSLKNTQCQAKINTTPSIPTVADTLVVPVATIDGLLQCAYLSGLLTTTFTSLDFPALQTLLGSWLLKLAIWPDLLSFDSDDIFNFQLSFDSAPTLGYLDAGLNLAVYTPSTAGLSHYVDLSTTLNGPSELSVMGGTLNYSQTTNRLKVRKKWDHEYVEEHHPVRWIFTRLIGNYLKTFLSDTGFNYVLPTVQNPGNFSLAVDSATFDTENASILLQIKSLP